MKVGALFAGYGGLELGLARVLPAEPAWFSEVEPAPCAVLAHRYPGVPNLGDITKVEWSAVEPVDVVTGGFPCQDVSHAGKRAGLKPDTRTGLWSHMAHAIATLRPALVVAENVRGLLSAEAHSDVEQCPWCVGGAADGEPPLRALGAVLADLAELGYDAAWIGLRAADVGAPHGRFRVFVLAWPADAAGDAGWLGNGDDRVAPADTDRVGGERGRAARDGRAGPAHGGQPAVALLPTPAVNDMGEGKTLEWWDEWAPRQKSSTGRPAPHGTTLAIEALRMLPTPRSSDGEKGGPNQRGSSGDLMLPSAVQDFGPYAPAVARWEAVLGRPAPAPTEPTGKGGAHRLSARFVEFLMGLPDGWVTDVPGVTRNQALKALGNGVVPQQAAAAIAHLLAVKAS